jgi:CDP-2,3-bis-(O-geranylgeranyl)-sn-glycerol synthase
MLDKIVFALFFFLPVGIANGTPVFVAKFPILKNLNYPLDFGKNFRGKRILGDHKTIRGLVFGVLMGIVTLFIEQQIYSQSGYLKRISPIDYKNVNVLLFGTLCGLGAIIGDSVKSFFKRRVGVLPGKAWVPFDQIDYIFGGILFTLPYIQLDFIYYPIIFVCYLIIHPVTTVIGYLIKVKDSPI